MNIFAPINPSSDISALSTVADEFYCGVMDPTWESIHTPYIGYNTRGFSGSRANFPTWEALAQTISQSNAYGIGCYLTVNTHNLTTNQLPLIRDIVQKFKLIGGAGIICSDLNGLVIAKNEGLRTYLSTNMTVYNIRALHYLERYYDFDRIILSRDMTIEDIRHIREATDKEIEVFGQNLGCRFSNGLCFCTHHCRQGGMCKSSMESTWCYHPLQKQLSFSDLYEIKLNHFIYSEFLLQNACALCSLYDFLDMGINSIKVVGRELNNQNVMASCALLRTGIQLARQSKNREVFWHHLQCSSEIGFADCCKWGLQCYYPEVANPAWIKGGNRT